MSRESGLIDPPSFFSSSLQAGHTWRPCLVCRGETKTKGREMPIQEGSIEPSVSVQHIVTDNPRQSASSPFPCSQPARVGFFLCRAISIYRCGMFKPGRCRCRYNYSVFKASPQRTPSRMMLCTVFYKPLSRTVVFFFFSFFTSC